MLTVSIAGPCRRFTQECTNSSGFVEKHTCQERAAWVLVYPLPTAKLTFHRRVGNEVDRHLEEGGLSDEDYHTLMTVRSYVHEEVEQGPSRVHLATGQGNITELREALQEQPWAIDTLYRGDAPIHVAVLRNDTTSLSMLMAAGANVNCRDRLGLTPLMFASKLEGTECMNMLLADPRCRSHVNQGDVEDMTALHYAAREGGPANIASLLAAGASVKVVDSGDWTPLHQVARNRRFTRSKAIEVVHLFQSHQANLDVLNDNGSSPFHVALLKSKLPILRALVEAGASTRLVDDTGENTLHLAAQHCNRDCINYLAELDLGVDAMLCNYVGNTAWAEFLLTTNLTDWEISPITCRRPSLAARDAFAKLFFRVLLQNLTHRLDLTARLRRAAEQRDEAASCTQLDLLIQESKLTHRKDLASWYRGIRSYVLGGSWELAMEEIEGDIEETETQLQPTRMVVERYSESFAMVSRFLRNGPYWFREWLRSGKFSRDAADDDWVLLGADETGQAF